MRFVSVAVEVERGDTLSGICQAVGLSGWDWPLVWMDSMNVDLRQRRGAPSRIRPGDVVQIPASFYEDDDTR